MRIRYFYLVGGSDRIQQIGCRRGDDALHHGIRQHEFIGPQGLQASEHHHGALSFNSLLYQWSHSVSVGRLHVLVVVEVQVVELIGMPLLTIRVVNTHVSIIYTQIVVHGRIQLQLTYIRSMYRNKEIT